MSGVERKASRGGNSKVEFVKTGANLKWTIMKVDQCSAEEFMYLQVCELPWGIGFCAGTVCLLATSSLSAHATLSVLSLSLFLPLPPRTPRLSHQYFTIISISMNYVRSDNDKTGEISITLRYTTCHRTFVSRKVYILLNTCINYIIFMYNFITRFRT